MTCVTSLPNPEFIIRPNQRITLFIWMLVDAVITLCAFAIAYRIRSSLSIDRFVVVRPLSEYIWLAYASIPVTLLIHYFSGLFAPASRIPSGSLMFALLRGLVLQVILLGSLVFFFQAKIYSRSLFALFMVLHLILHATWRFLWRSFENRFAVMHAKPRHILLIGLNQLSTGIAARIAAHSEWNMKVAGFLQTGEPAGQQWLENNPEKRLGHFEDLDNISKRIVIDEVIFCVGPAEIPGMRTALRRCEELGIRAHIVADFFQLPIARPHFSYLDDIPLLSFTTTPFHALHLFVKRLIDITVASVLLVVFLIPMLIISIAIRLDSPGPVLFSQSRVGKNGRRFKLYKFRSMIRDAEQRRTEIEQLNEMSGPVFKSSIDPRITRVGRWIRRTSLDELPQLINVILGDMSLVGPRPALPDEVVQYEAWQRRRVSMKPGLTCIWQISGRNQVDFEDWMRMDLEYIDHWSLGLDFLILIRTIPAVLSARGAK